MSSSGIPDSSSIDVDGLETALRRRGDGVPLLYLHDQATAGRWLALHDELSRRFDVIAPDHPGFGQTPMPPKLTDFTDLVLHYDALLDALDLPAVHIAGTSFGAWIAAELAVFLPRRTASLTLVAPMGLRVPGTPTVDQFRWSVQKRATEFVADAPEAALLVGADEHDIEESVRLYSDGITFARLAWNPRYDARLDTRLARVSAPTLVVAPEGDTVVSRQHAQRYAELIPDARFTTVPEADGRPAPHLLGLVQPERVAELVQQTANRTMSRSAT